MASAPWMVESTTIIAVAATVFVLMRKKAPNETYLSSISCCCGCCPCRVQRDRFFVAQMLGQLRAKRPLDQCLLELLEQPIVPGQVLGLLMQLLNSRQSGI